MKIPLRYIAGYLANVRGLQTGYITDVLGITPTIAELWNDYFPDVPQTVFDEIVHREALQYLGYFQLTGQILEDSRRHLNLL